MAKMLSAHFSEDEFRCRDGSTHAINPKLLTLLEKLRAKAGKPIIINSGYRSLAYNTKIGGAKKSQHMLGNAADITIKGYTPAQVRDMAEAVGFTGLGLYDTFTHVDVRPNKTKWDLRKVKK